MIRENSLKQYRVLAHSHVARTLLVFIALMLGAFSAQAMTATITPATGGGAIPSNSAPACSATGWTALTGPSVAETQKGDFQSGTIILNAPAGFVFDTAGTAPTVVLTAGDGNSNKNVNNVAVGTPMTVTSVTSSQITFNISAKTTGNLNTLTWQNIRVQPTAATPQASGNMTDSGSLGIVGNLGTLTEVASTPVCSPPQPIATYRMDEAGWTGTANEVADSSGNGNNAQSFNSSTTDGVTSAIAGSPGTCRYGVFDNGTTTIASGYIQTPLPDLTTNFTVTAWVRTTNNAATGQRILIDDQSNSGGYGISLGDGASGKIRFYSRAINPVILDSTYTLANNNWYFVAAVADITNRIRTIYVYSSTGTLLNSTSDAAAFTGTWGTDAGPVSIGGETNASSETPTGFHFHGNLDEVQVFKAALSQTQLAQIATQTHACAVAGPDHILVQHDGNGLTCTPETLTVTACANAACTAPNYTASSVTGNVSWTGTPGGSVPFNITTNGTTTVSLPVTTVQTVTLGTSAVSPPAASSCWNTSTSTASCSLSFADSGLLISAPNHAAESLQNMTISAVRKANNALNCVPAFANVSRAVNLKCVYTNPASGTLSARVAGVVLNAGNNAATACDSTGQNPTLHFDSNGTATPTLQYADVGKVTLNGTYTGSAGTGDAGLIMTGSGSFIAAPASFGFSGVTAGPIKAGNAFGATVSALNATGAVAPNLGQENLTLSPPNNVPEGVTLSFSKCQPTGTNSSSGTFSGSVGSFAGGVANATNLNWNEVGNGDLVATLASGSYLGSGLTVTGNTGTAGTVCNGGGAGNVGRFIPDHFNTVVTPGMLCPSGLTCPTLFVANDQGFVYSGQPFTANVYARNALDGTTVNYDGTANTSPNFAKPVTLNAWDAPGSTTTNNPPNASGSSLGYGAIPAVFSKGTTFLGTPATLVYTFGTTPTVPTNIYIRAADADATSLRLPASTSVEGGVEVVSGKISISNAYGSEMLPLPLTATVQYWNGINWVISATDSLTQFNTNLSSTSGGNIVANILTGLGGGISVATPGVVTMAAGVTTFTLNRPKVPGSVDISLNAPNYLLVGSNGASVNPSKPGRAIFGVYKGSQNFIYLRENY
jgi:MSHA biogenesis protein MshQ